ncbi:Inducible metalloproteinase inhibitor protein [Eufriesea mexicana]|uniref:Inducible metalloproteinase inhibitor protein n=1 Tax=Eufriesea mexicana TaxID=516756 RepID=A0A310SGI6_9HYME|nr:PREDICTED: inducible metalloproteinase inhibitor protein-like isoform X1 [Eufriesea mexicana]XP_017761197.1 PREDICTED: inducible metalloproteinase inhibitor protein-like isoform X2 [Eufriesea mexicana]OAD54560.1 Inducible metalloproteinase inhibitor protein [Eufriesea mexicana]
MSRFVVLLFVTLAVLYTAAYAKKLVCDMPNEEYHCGSACQTTCATLGQPCPIKNIRCNDACYCKSGYARNRRGICIPVQNCSKRRHAVPLLRLDSILY